MAKMGAKGKYQDWLSPEKLAQLQAWKRDGLTDNEIAENIGISRSTYYAWLNKHRDISDSIKKGQEQMIVNVENALYKRAIGYEYTEKKVKIQENHLGSTTIREQVVKDVAPDVGAAIFILKNRSDGKWRDKREYDMSTDSVDKLGEVLARLDEKMFEEDEGLENG